MGVGVALGVGVTVGVALGDGVGVALDVGVAVGVGVLTGSAIAVGFATQTRDVPAPFVADTRTVANLPTIADVQATVFVVEFAVTQSEAFAGPVEVTTVGQAYQMYEKVGAGVPFHVPVVTVVAPPTVVAPDMTGAVDKLGKSIT